MPERGSHRDNHASESSSGSGSGCSSGGYGLWFSVIVFVLSVVTEICKMF